MTDDTDTQFEQITAELQEPRKGAAFRIGQSIAVTTMALLGISVVAGAARLAWWAITGTW